ncbi:hypothetical protein ONZ45_g12639 [Pleurotus djamor]|nr:hypothetical protein ONZ45_g12639 [Pleurotus djamor]
MNLITTGLISTTTSTNSKRSKMSSIINFLDGSPTIEEVDKKISAMRAEIRVLEQYRNARLLIVSRLPTEVLSIVFTHMALEKNTDVSRSRNRSPYSHWLPVTQVCRLWRDAALSTPRMWGRIYGSSKAELAELFLERAKLAPLYLCAMHEYECASFHTAAVFFERAAQVKELELRLPSLSLLPQFAQTRFPLLERLTIDASDYLAAQGRNVFSFAPSDIGSVQPLQHLKLLKCNISNLQVHCFPRLVSLDIQLTARDVHIRIPVIDLCTAMSKMECLESLTLIHAISASSASFPEDAVALVPRLTCIHIHTDSALSLALLSHIACPALQSMIVCIKQVTTADTMASTARAFYSLLPCSSSYWKTILHVERNCLNEYQATVSVSPSTDSSTQVDKGLPTPAFLLTVMGSNDYSVYLSLSSLCPFTDPPILDLNVPYDPDSTLEFRGCLRALTDVEELRISDFDTLVSIILHDTPPEPPKKGKGKRSHRQDKLPPFCLPSLKCIDFLNVGRIKYKDRNMKRLMKLLVARKAIDAGIEMVKMTKGYVFSEDDVALFESEVETVEILPSRAQEPAYLDDNAWKYG